MSEFYPVQSQTFYLKESSYKAFMLKEQKDFFENSLKPICDALKKEYKGLTSIEIHLAKEHQSECFWLVDIAKIIQKINKSNFSLDTDLTNCLINETSEFRPFRTLKETSMNPSLKTSSPTVNSLMRSSSISVRPKSSVNPYRASCCGSSQTFKSHETRQRTKGLKEKKLKPKTLLESKEAIKNKRKSK